MKWNRGRQLDSYKMTISVKDIVDILDGKNKRLIKNLLQMGRDYEYNNNEFKKIHGRSCNSSIMEDGSMWKGKNASQ